MGRRADAIGRVSNLKVLADMRREVNDDIRLAKAQGAATALVSARRLKFEIMSRIDEVRVAERTAAGQDLTDAELCAEMEVNAQEMPDDHLAIFVREWSRRGRAYPPPELE